MLPKVSVDFDPQVVIQCPAMDFKPRRVIKACPGCNHFRGIAEMCAEESYPWHKRFVVRCAHVMERRTHVIEVIEE